MDLLSLFSGFRHYSLPRVAVTIIAVTALAWSSPAFCGEIHDAAKAGDFATVQALLKANPDLAVSKDDHGATPLCFAAMSGRTDIAELLLANKAEVNAKDSGGNSPLLVAALYGHANVAELLLANKAEVDITDNDRVTPLQAAAENGHKDVVELLLASKANVNAKDVLGQTALMYAAHGGYADIVRLLLAKGADVFDKNNKGYNALVVGQAGGRDVLLALLEKVGEDSLDQAAADGDLKKVKGALNDHPDWVFSKDAKGWTPLHYAAVSGHKEVAELLLADKAQVNARDNDGMTPLHYAAGKGYMEVAELLLAKGADVNAKDNLGQTPLHMAENKDVAQLLLANRADVNANTNGGTTPLFYAMTYGHTDVAELLRQHGGLMVRKSVTDATNLTSAVAAVPPSLANAHWTAEGVQIKPPGAIRVAGSVQAAKLIKRTKPVYPSAAAAANLAGTVRLSAQIGKDGTVQHLQSVSGPPTLIQPAVDAVQHWLYKPTLLRGEPVVVLTNIEVTFMPAKGHPANEPATKQEDDDWARARATGTADAYKKFLMLHPDSQRLRVISGTASYQMALPTGPIDSNGGTVSQVIITIGNSEVYVDLARAKSLGLVQNLGGVITQSKEPGPATVYAAQKGENLILLAIEN